MKAPRLTFQQEAKEDIGTIADYIAGHNPGAAERFFIAVDDLCELLIHTPNIGSPRIFQSPRLHGMRVMPLGKFERYLVFYRVNDDTVQILRVIHGMRDYPALFK